MPSLYISHKGESALNFSTAIFTVSMVASISSSVVNLPIDILKELWANSSYLPIALKTKLGSSDAEVQADPLETAISLVAIISDSPST